MDHRQAVCKFMYTHTMFRNGSNSFEDYIMLPEVKQLHSSVRNYSTAPIKLTKKLGIRSRYEMFVYTSNKNLLERHRSRRDVNQVEYSTSEKAKTTVEEESKAASVCFFIKFGNIHQCHLKFIAMLNLNRSGIEKDLKRCRKLKNIILCLHVFYPRHFSRVRTTELIKFKLSSDIKKNPGPIVDPSKTIILSTLQPRQLESSSKCWTTVFLR